MSAMLIVPKHVLHMVWILLYHLTDNIDRYSKVALLLVLGSIEVLGGQNCLNKIKKEMKKRRREMIWPRVQSVSSRIQLEKYSQSKSYERAHNLLFLVGTTL